MSEETNQSEPVAADAAAPASEPAPTPAPETPAAPETTPAAPELALQAELSPPDEATAEVAAEEGASEEEPDHPSRRPGGHRPAPAGPQHNHRAYNPNAEGRA